jgi:hypothetical protein
MLKVAVPRRRHLLEVIRLEVGQRPSDDTDCVKVEETSDGRFALTGTALCQLGGDDAESVTLVGTTTFEKMSKAEEAGLVWANAQGVQVLYVGYGTLEHPIAQTEIDAPL